MIIIPSTIKFRRGTTTPPTLAMGEPGFDSSTGRLYMGTGTGNYMYYNSNEMPTFLYNEVANTSSTSGKKIGLTGQASNAGNSIVDFRTYTNVPDSSVVYGVNSFMTGHLTLATGSSGFAANSQTTASADSSSAFGKATTAAARGSLTLGIGSQSYDAGQLSLGFYNKVSPSPSPDLLSLSSDALVIGNGSASTKSNCFRVKYDGNVYGLAAFNATGADYAEYFEWADGNTKNEDRVGRFVKLTNGNKISVANWTNASELLGVVSHVGAIVGNAHSESWGEMYLKDDFGRVQYDIKTGTNGETIKTPKINPNYNPNLPYIPREDRKEWDPVGLLGRLRVRDDGTCEVGGFCMCGTNGVAINSSKGYKVLARVSTNVVEILYK